MKRIGIQIGLDTGDLVSSAGRARQSIAGLTDEMKKARKEGRTEDYEKLSSARNSLNARTSDFTKDIRTLANDPRFQAKDSAWTTLKLAPEYANAIKSQTEALKRLTDEYQSVIRSGNVGKIQELTPQIERQQAEFHKTVQDIINTKGNFPQNPPPDHNTSDNQKNQSEPRETVHDSIPQSPPVERISPLIENHPIIANYEPDNRPLTEQLENIKKRKEESQKTLDTGDFEQVEELNLKIEAQQIEFYKAIKRRTEEYQKVFSSGDVYRSQELLETLQNEIQKTIGDIINTGSNEFQGSDQKVVSLPETLSIPKGITPKHIEALNNRNTEYQRSLDLGDFERAQELTPQIEALQAEFHKALDELGRVDLIPQTPPVPVPPVPVEQISPLDNQKETPLDNNLPDQKNPPVPLLPEHKDWRELKGLSGAITQEHDVGNWGQVARLGNSKDTLQGIIGEYDRDSKLGAKLKADPEFSSQLREIRDALKGTIAALNEAAAKGEYEKVDQLTAQARQLQGLSHNAIQDAATPSSKKGEAALASFLNVQTAQQIVGAVTGGINTYVAHLDRSSIVNAMGSGDVMGAQIDELHRSAAEQSAWWGSIGRIGGGILGGIVGSLIAPGIGTAAGAALGSTLLGAGGDLVGTLGDEKKANEMATSAAYAKLWERQAPSAMELTAVLGKYGKSSEQNSRILRHTWENAANTATEYGFSPEEGVEQVKQAAYQGLNEGQALGAARDVFAFERGTGADRGTLSEFRNRTERFGISGGLNTAWQGNQASGMAPAQFNEFLRSMQRTFEDGISKGFVRGAGEIAGNLSFLSNLNSGSELWKGEQGANRLSQMNAGLAATTALSSASDILSFRGAQNVLKQWDKRGDAAERWKSIGDLDPKKGGLEIRRGYDYIDAMLMLERGLTPELFHSQMQMIQGVEGVGNRTGAVEQRKNIYGLNYTGAAALYQSYQDKLKTFGGDKGAAEKYFSGAEWEKKLEGFKANPDYNNSTELTMFRNVADIKKYTYEIGQWHLDKKMPEIVEALKKAWEEAREKGGTRDTNPGEHEKEYEPYPPPPENQPDPTDTSSPSGNEPLGWEDRARQAVQRRNSAKEFIRYNPFSSDATFFKGDLNPFSDNDDEKAYNRFLAYADPQADPQANAAFDTAAAIMKQFPEEAIKKADKENLINAAIPDVMSDRTGEQLIQALLVLASNLDVTITEEILPGR